MEVAVGYGSTVGYGNDCWLWKYCWLWKSCCDNFIGMSLLTSPQTTREQQRFFGKMEREFNRRSFHNSNYVQPASPLQQVNDNTDRAHELISQAMQLFLSQLTNIITDSRNSRIDYYFVLNEMKSTDFFSEVAALLSKDLMQRSSRVQKESGKLREETKKALQRVRELERGETPKPPPTPDFRFNSIKSIADNLYEKAKVLNAGEFAALCDRTLLGEKVVIKRVSGERSEDETLKRIAAALDAGRSPQEQQLAEVIAQLKGQVQVQQQWRCNQPCCQTLTQSNIKRPTKAASLRRSSEARKSHDIYQSDRSEEYFNRYYRRSEFDMKKVSNVEKTKLQEMEKIEDDYRINLKQRKKNFTLFSR